jgi:ABC-type dipeptide/oligopeptide/nickel transport system ATPase component
MNLILPKKQQTDTTGVLDTKEVNTVVIIGANGAGKSLFGKEMGRLHQGPSQRISGVSSLYLNRQEDVPRNNLDYLQDVLSGRSVSLLSEYEKLVIRLQSEEFDAAVHFKEASKENRTLLPPVTKIDRIQTIWEKMFPHNRLIRTSGFIELASASNLGNHYSAERMSDGERIVFFLIGTVLCAEKEALLVIEEPTLLLHDSIKNSLWDEIEHLRPDCTFVYLTHDIEFASSRTFAKRIWIRSYDADTQVWDYELLATNQSFPEELYMSLLGSRKPILFIEGVEATSIDSRLYPLIFPDYMVKPMGGCQKVIETTKAFRQLKDFHTLESMGIVDRDRRTRGEVEYLNSQHILVPDVAEVENLLLLEPVIRTVAARLRKNPDTVFYQTRDSIIRLFETDLDDQALLHAKHRVRKRLETSLNKKIQTVQELTKHVADLQDSIPVEELYLRLRNKFAAYVEQRDYKSILRVYNQKGMLGQSRLCALLGINNKDNYLNLVLSILKDNGESAETIRIAIKGSLGI